jgi:glutathione peroxidase-family protein
VIAPSVHIPVSRIDGNLTTLAEYQGSLLLIVNVASACGLTPRYAALESVYEKVHAHGLEVLGFPCNDFARRITSSSGCDSNSFHQSAAGVAPNRICCPKSLAVRASGSAPAAADALGGDSPRPM